MPSKRPARSGTRPARRDTLLAGRAEAPDRKTVLYGAGPSPDEIEAYWKRKGYGGPRGDLPVRELRNEKDRRPNILADEAAIFPIEENPDADPTPPWSSWHSKGRDAVAKYERLIGAAAERYGVDPDLVKMVMYTENARGWWTVAGEPVGASATILPMNVNSEMWQQLGVTPEEAKDPAANIDLGVRLIKRLVERAPGASAGQIETLYNSLYAEKTNQVGAQAQQACDQRLWEKEEAPEFGFWNRGWATVEQGWERLRRLRR
ncbi:hypothetical protein SAMN06265365_103197 [Tistlia consotensis]|uniref:Transglycosylase SLT domain-containing protein n=1 Tax=Tistlia consotensis USBA 355 TaxID=560819 RepID=A0A1Y6BRH9_9PROT|nr:hypothetical protein [Tistlia consotensis]SMF16189.1 hypothetical protein SAMN05428998_10630 [Tistlia consotensis USBA 355]SNR41358.1 hypothetical protein SAMN06265365_103197 [Tistlia consotensis]